MAEESEWQRVLEQLTRQVPQLAESFLTRILVDPAYSDSDLTMEDLKSSSERSLQAILRSLADGARDFAALSSLAAELGSRRAQQRMPLDNLTRAIRMDFSVLWEALSAPSIAVDPALLVSKTDMVWRVVDTFAAQVQASYLAESEALELADADLQHQYLSKLLATAEPSVSDVRRIAGALNVETTAEFLAAAINRDDSLAVKRRITSRPRRTDRIFTLDQGHHTVVVLQRRGRGSAELTFDEASLFEGIAAAVAPTAFGIAGVRAAVLAAREIMADLPSGATGVFRLEDRWESLARHRLAQVGCDPAQLVLPHLDRCTEGERSRLLQTVSTFLETGSLVQTSAVLQCHRNTVVHRLSTFEKYTGLNVQMPRDAATALLALGPSARQADMVRVMSERLSTY